MVLILYFVLFSSQNFTRIIYTSMINNFAVQNDLFNTLPTFVDTKLSMDKYQIDYMIATDLVSSYYELFTNTNKSFMDTHIFEDCLTSAWLKQNIIFNDSEFKARLKTRINSTELYGHTSQG